MELFKGQDLGQIQAELAAIPAKDAGNALFSLICREDPALRWPAITCMGVTLARLADQKLEEARIMMRRFLWSLNDESGGIGWGAPESMAEAMCCHEALAVEYVHMLISYMREDGEELHQDGNFIEHPLLQRGLLWGVARLSGCRPELLRQKGAATDIPPFLHSQDGEVRGLAALACGRLGVKAAETELQQLIDDTESFQLYNEGTFSRLSVGQLAKQALEAMG
ncbi:MAG: HEAT repeat domain-containing protein [Desulfobulbus sp.]|nr:HEAT repeat domain-containing protein [Desulfobulbus sp.]